MASIVSSRSLSNITAAQKLECADRLPSDGDIDIAQGLLICPRIPTRKYPVSQFVEKNNVIPSTSDTMDDNCANLESTDELPQQQVIHTSNAWTSSSGDALSDLDDLDKRSEFLDEYNRLANKHGVRTLSPDNDEADNALMTGKPNWFKRNILRRTSSAQSIKGDKLLKHRRSISELSGRLKLKKDTLKDKSLPELVRLCGLSLLYLPIEYASRSLALPTCFRATAQHLVQYGVNSRGIFRIPGSHSTVTALYNHYGTLDEDGDVIAGTVRCPTLPSHIKCDVYDVASAFKKFLAGLPDGILGSLPLFYSFVSIHGQLLGDPELTKTKQTKIRARLIALAIMTLKSKYRRDLICAVFGLLSMIGRAAEIAPREDDRGRPLPTSDLMGYAPLGIVFGPLLLGELLDNYTMRVANPHGPLVLLPVSPPKGRRDKHSRSQKHHTHMHKRSKSDLASEGATFSTQIDKVIIANKVTEMLITHWRDVIRHLKDLQPCRAVRDVKGVINTSYHPPLRPSASESFTLRKPPDWGGRQVDGALTTPTRGSIALQATKVKHQVSVHNDNNLVVKKQRGRPQHVANQILKTSRSISVLSPTQEEVFSETDDQEFPSPNKIQEVPESRSPNQKENRSFQETPQRRSSVQFNGNGKGDPEPCLEKYGHVEGTKQIETLEHARKLSSAKKPSLKVTITRSTGIQTSSKVTENRRRRTAATDPGNWPLKLEKPSVLQSLARRKSSWPFRGLESVDGAGRDDLERVPHQEDLVSLAALASALTSSDSMTDELKTGCPDEQESRSQKSINFVRKHFKNSSPNTVGQSKASCSPKAIESSPSSPKRLLKVFGSQKNRHSNKTSSTVDTSFSTSSKTQSGLVSTLESKNTTPCSDIRGGYLLSRTPSPGKQVKVQSPITSLGPSPYGTVKALAAKFETVDLMSVHRQSPTKLPIKGPSYEFSIYSSSPKKAIVAAYTMNEVSPAKSQKSDATIPPELSLAQSKSAEAGITVDRNDRLPCNRLSSPYLSTRNSPQNQTKSPTPTPNSSKNITPIKNTHLNASVGQYSQDYRTVTQDTPRCSNNYSTRISAPIIPLPFQITPSSPGGRHPSQVQETPYSITDGQYNRNSDAPRSPFKSSRIMHSQNRPVSLPNPPKLSGALSATQAPLKYDPFFPNMDHGSPRGLSRSPNRINTLNTIGKSSPTMPSNSKLYHTKALRIETTHEHAPSNNLIVDGSSASPEPVRRCTSATKAPQTQTEVPDSHDKEERYPPHDGPYPVPTRSNSVLSAQVQAFRRELELKSDEIRHLKQLLNSRNNLAEFGELSRELRYSRDAIGLWRSRAQVAEKQIEILTQMARASTSFQPHLETLAIPKAQHCRPNVEKKQEGGELINTIRTPEELNMGLDGAVNTQRTISGESSDTVVRSSDF